MKSFKPFLAPNDKIELDDIKYPLLASTKLDGYRCIFYKGEILTRSLKQVQNKQLREKFEALRKYTADNNLVLDGEIYSHEITFQELNKYFMSEDLESARSIKRYGEVLKMPEHVKFYMFDSIYDDNLTTEFIDRVHCCEDVAMQFSDITVLVNQERVEAKGEVEEMFEVVLSQGYEGLILKDPQGRYKCGRGTVKEGLIFKVKPFLTFDAEIIGVGQSTECINKTDDMLERLEVDGITLTGRTYGEIREIYEQRYGKLKTTNELGRSVTSKKKGDRIPIEMACEFHVLYEGLKVKPVLAMTNEEKKEVWKNRESYIGKMIEYKGMLVGAKDVPRHPVFVRFREDKD